jgi:hypothetical protein
VDEHAEPSLAPPLHPRIALRRRFSILNSSNRMSSADFDVAALKLSNGWTDKKSRQQDCDSDQVTVGSQEISSIKVDGDEGRLRNIV